MEIKILFILTSTGESFELGFQPEDTLEKACSYFRDNFQAYSNVSISFIHMGKILGDETMIKDIDLNKKHFIAIFVDTEEEDDEEEEEFVKNEEDLKIMKFRMYINDEENQKRIKDLVLENPVQNFAQVLIEFEEKFGSTITRFLASDVTNLLNLLDISEFEYVQSLNFNRVIHELNEDEIAELKVISEKYKVPFRQTVLEYDVCERNFESAIERIRNIGQPSDQEYNESREEEEGH